MFRIVQDEHNGHFKVFPDSQDHLGEDQHLRHQGVGQEQGLPQRVNFCKKNSNNRVVQDCYYILNGLTPPSPPVCVHTKWMAPLEMSPHMNMMALNH